MAKSKFSIYLRMIPSALALMASGFPTLKLSCFGQHQNNLSQGSVFGSFNETNEDNAAMQGLFAQVHEVFVAFGQPGLMKLLRHGNLVFLPVIGGVYHVFRHIGRNKLMTVFPYLIIIIFLVSK